MNSYGHCDRCDSWSREYLKTHAHCWECDLNSINDEYEQWGELELGRRSHIPGFQIRPNRAHHYTNGGTE